MELMPLVIGLEYAESRVAIVALDADMRELQHEISWPCVYAQDLASVPCSSWYRFALKKLIP